jgi:hypothetical protein
MLNSLDGNFPGSTLEVTMTHTPFHIGSMLLALMVQILLISSAPAADTPTRHRVILFYSANTLGEMEPCGG